MWVRTGMEDHGVGIGMGARRRPWRRRERLTASPEAMELAGDHGGGERPTAMELAGERRNGTGKEEDK